MQSAFIFLKGYVAAFCLAYVICGPLVSFNMYAVASSVLEKKIIVSHYVSIMYLLKDRTILNLNFKVLK